MKYTRIVIWVFILVIFAMIATAIFQPKEEFKLPNDNHNETNMNDGEIKHSIPLEEILSGGPGKDGIPSIDNPVFDTSETTDQSGDTIGIGIEINGDVRFYGYNILVWHEIANDTIGGTDAAVTYCPLCGTGIAFDRNVDGQTYEFGVSGQLWQSNLLMYNRTGNETTESLWSQILGEAVVGPFTGKKLTQLPGDTTRLSDWLTKFPDSKILSTDTGERRDYTRDPYGNYYTDESTIFPTANSADDRLHPKGLVQGIEIDGQFKAYKDSDITSEVITDTFAGSEITLTRNTTGQIEITADGIRIEPIRSFWFSWAAVHTETKLFIK
jgi:hypothetical protein